MNNKVAAATVDCHRAIGETRPRMLKADLSKGEKRAFWPELGACLDAARREVGWTIDQLAAEVQRDAKQVGRWMRGEERTQVDAVFCVPSLRWPFLKALAAHADAVHEERLVKRTA